MNRNTKTYLFQIRVNMLRNPSQSRGRVALVAMAIHVQANRGCRRWLCLQEVALVFRDQMGLATAVLEL
jgi:hypothetical protein